MPKKLLDTIGSPKKSKKFPGTIAVTLSNNGTLEFDEEDGSIRYVDVDGNCEGKWEPGDEDYFVYKLSYFPTCHCLDDLT